MSLWYKVKNGHPKNSMHKVRNAGTHALSVKEHSSLLNAVMDAVTFGKMISSPLDHLANYTELVALKTSLCFAWSLLCLGP